MEARGSNISWEKEGREWVRQGNEWRVEKNEKKKRKGWPAKCFYRGREWWLPPF
jgi:hypothetical protein